MSPRERRAFEKAVFGPDDSVSPADIEAARKRSEAAEAARVLARAMGMAQSQIDRAGSYAAECLDPIRACQHVEEGTRP